MIDQIISHYHIVEKLGGGGMGVVYKAEDSRPCRQQFGNPRCLCLFEQSVLLETAALPRARRTAIRAALTQVSRCFGNLNSSSINALVDQDGEGNLYRLGRQ